MDQDTVRNLRKTMDTYGKRLPEDIRVALIQVLDDYDKILTEQQSTVMIVHNTPVEMPETFDFAKLFSVEQIRKIIRNEVDSCPTCKSTWISRYDEEGAQITWCPNGWHDVLIA